VPIPWEADAPSYGFGPSAKTWLPQPEVWRQHALDIQRGVTGSTYEFYRAAIELRRSRGLGSGSLTVVDGWGPDVLALQNGEVLILANLGPEPVVLPDGAVVLVASQALDEADGVVTVACDVAIWARLSEESAG
jgi:alpha-glucosidase